MPHVSLYCRFEQEQNHTSQTHMCIFFFYVQTREDVLDLKYLYMYNYITRTDMPRVAPDTDLAGYTANILAGIRYPAGYLAK